MPSKIHKLLRMTYNDINEFFGLVPGAWRPSKCLVKKRESNPQNIPQSSKEDLANGILNDQPRLSLSLSLFGRPVIVNIRIINAFTVEPKCLCCPDRRLPHIFIRKKLSSTQHLYSLPVYENKKENLKGRKKKTHTVNHAPKNKL